MISDKSDHELNQEWLRLAPAWIKEVREGRNSARVGLLDGPMLAACGDVRGLRILDSGCGEGRFRRILVGRGAEYVLGLDLCEPMMDAAKELAIGRDTYHLADVRDLGFLADRTFDLAVSYRNQCDLADFSANNREIFRVRRQGGRFIVANLHPMRSATGGWHKTADGAKHHAILDRYFEEGERLALAWSSRISTGHFLPTPEPISKRASPSKGLSNRDGAPPTFSRT